MKFSRVILAAALAIGLGTAVSANPLLPSAAEVIQQPDTVVEYAKRKGGKGWKGHRGRHYGWYRGRHRGWYKPRGRVYYAPPRRHYGHYRGRHYGWSRRRPARAVYFRF
jgi:hypothetical protein